MMTIPLQTNPSRTPTPIYCFRAPEWEQTAAARPENQKNLAATHDFRAQAGRILLVPATDGSVERVLFGLGDAPSPMIFGALGRDLPQGEYKLFLPPREVSESQIGVAFALGAYVFDRYKPRRRPLPRLILSEAAVTEATRIARAVHLARDLVNTPAADMGPSALAGVAESVAREIGATFEAIVGDALLVQNYPMVHAVGRAAADPPRLVRLTCGPATAPLVTLVGKGITFDTGGLDIKPDAGMRLMKKDMGGAAIALALGRLAAEAQLPVRLEIILAIAENAISGNAFRPGDVVDTRKGLSVEVDNTDAEGRLVLADALALAMESAPALTLDFATLTGAARVALGPDVTPFFTGDDSLAAELADAGAETGDALWRMPLWDGYDSEMDSPIADLKNTGDGGHAGAIYGGLFLRRFVDQKAWAHFDTFCWSPKDKPGRPAGGDAQALRAAYAMLRKRFAK